MSNPLSKENMVAAANELITMDAVVEKFLEVRKLLEDLDAQWEAKRKPVQDFKNLLAGRLQKHLDDNKVESMRTKAGTAYKKTTYTASVADPKAFMDFVVEGQHFDLLERRANVTAVKAYVEEHKALPTGVNLSSYEKVNVRR